MIDIDKSRIPKELIPILEANLQGRIDTIVFPPPVFDAMQGEIIEYNQEDESIRVRFPVLHEQLNPYGTMQGGIIAAAIDNTIGPLSMLVSTPNFTRYMNVKYGKAIPLDLGSINVSAKFTGQKKRQLYFEALVEDSDGNKLASAKATHWVID